MAVSWDDQPRTRGDCVDGPRPCPWLSCRYHLGLPFEGKRRSANTCSLDVADQGGLIQSELADELGLSKARVQQIEATALLKFRLAVIQDDATREPSGSTMYRSASERPMRSQRGSAP